MRVFAATSAARRSSRPRRRLPTRRRSRSSSNACRRQVRSKRGVHFIISSRDSHPRPVAPPPRAAITAPPSLSPPRSSGSARASSCRREARAPAKNEEKRGCGAEGMMGGAAYAEAQERCDAYVADSGALLIHPYDAVETVAGQGTVALGGGGDLDR